MAPALFNEIDVPTNLTKEDVAARRPYNQGAARIRPDVLMAAMRPAISISDRILDNGPPRAAALAAWASTSRTAALKPCDPPAPDAPAWLST